MRIDFDSIDIPEDYVVQYFDQYVGYPKHKASTNIYFGGCPFCHEDTSWGKKARFFYIPKKKLIFCHNCGYSKRPHNFIMDVSGMSYNEMCEELSEYDIIPENIKLSDSEDKLEEKPKYDELPKDPINLQDKTQLKYYKDNKVVNIALEYIKSRKLDIAVNRPKTYYVSLTDFVHKNRLILPFYNSDDKIEYYQTRKLINDDSVKYLSKSKSEKILPNLNNIDTTIPYIFVFEGPIDSYFCKNSTAVSGIQENSDTLFTQKQKEQLKEFYLFDIIWVLDSQWKDKASLLKTKKLLSMNQSVFIWPEKYGNKFKDFNHMAVNLNLSEIPYNWIKNNTLSKVKALLILSQIESLVYS